MSNIADLVKTVKDFIKNQNASLEMSTLDGTQVITFYVMTEGDIAVGTKASPDGDFVLSNGWKVKIENGEVTEIEVEVDVPEPEAKNEDGEPQVEEPKQEEVVEGLEEVKQALEVANATIEELQVQLEEANKALNAKNEEFKNIEKDLNEIKNFYSKVNKGASEREELNQKPEEKFDGFRFKSKK